MRHLCGWIFILWITYTPLFAQCPQENTFFQAGEELRYDLYFRYGIINTKAGTSSLVVADETYNGTAAYKMTMLANTNGLANKMFSMKDTLTAYTSKNIVPLAFIKNAMEQGDYTQETALYDYSQDSITVKTQRIRNDILRFDEILRSHECIYDMVSTVYYARTLDFSQMKKGDKTTISSLSGKKIVHMDIEFQGIEKVKANDRREYNCIKLVLMINTSAFEDKKEAMKVYLSNDINRVPIRIDSQLKIGSTRAILKNYKGLRSHSN